MLAAGAASRTPLRTFAVAATAAPATAVAAPKAAHGFTLVREMYSKEYDSQVLMYRHDKTGEAGPGQAPKPGARCCSSHTA